MGALSWEEGNGNFVKCMRALYNVWELYNREGDGALYNVYGALYNVWRFVSNHDKSCVAWGRNSTNYSADNWINETV